MAASVDIDGLVARGLDRYRAGDIDGALAIWEMALAADPDDPRALGYVDYVRQNYDELSGGSAAPMSEQLIPFGLSRSDDDEYEISITRGEGGDPEATTGAHRPAVMPERLPEPAIDDGWGIDADADRTWFAGEHRRTAGLQSTMFEDDHSGDRTIERGHVQPRPGSDFDFGSDSDSESDFDFGGERTTERVPSAGPRALGPEVLKGLGIEPIAVPHPRAASDAPTNEGWPQAPDLELSEPVAPDPADPRTATVDFNFDSSDLGGIDLGGPGAPVVEPLPPPPPEFEERGTADLKIKRGGTNPGRIPTAAEQAAEDARGSVEVEDLMLPPPPSAAAHVDDDSREERMPPHRALTADEAVTEQLSREIDNDAPLLESHDERARRRIVALLARAQAAAGVSDHATAVAAIDLALSEAPDVAAAQKLVHRSRDQILECYYRFFGDLGRMPMLAAPLAELTRRPLDPRAAFLLSRIDGTLTYEEILDVAGMGRLEACRHLAHLLWRGIIRAS